MKTNWVKLGKNGQDGDAVAIRQAAELIRGGQVVAFPTETVYGLGGDALNPQAAERIYEAKGRPSDNPLIVHIADMDVLDRIAREVPAKARLLAERYWPGPLTMIFFKTDVVPVETTGGLSSVAVRMPSHPVAQELIRGSGGFIAAPSANTSGRPSPTRAEHVWEDLRGRIPMLLDGGPVGIGLESTIVDFTEEVPVVLRPGFLTAEMLREVLGEVRVDPGLFGSDAAVRPKAPGMKYRHYAPRAQMTVVQGEPQAVREAIIRLAGDGEAAGERVGILATDESLYDYRDFEMVKSVGSRLREDDVARHLYGVLRAFDECGVTCIYAESFAELRMGQAIMNRLLKAAGQRVYDAGTGELYVGGQPDKAGAGRTSYGSVQAGAGRTSCDGVQAGAGRTSCGSVQAAQSADSGRLCAGRDEGGGDGDETV